MAEATMDSIARDPLDADIQGTLAFDALWRALS